MSKLSVLQNSLIKKEQLLDAKFENHFATVKQANGQPLNDKRNGAATMAKWDRQSDSIRLLKESIEKTKLAIEKEERILFNNKEVRNILPESILKRIESGVLVQWKKHPETFFVNGVDRVRIVFDKKSGKIGHRYKNEVTNADQWRLFAQTFNAINLEMQINKTDK